MHCSDLTPDLAHHPCSAGLSAAVTPAAKPVAHAAASRGERQAPGSTASMADGDLFQGADRQRAGLKDVALSMKKVGRHCRASVPLGALEASPVAALPSSACRHCMQPSHAIGYASVAWRKSTACLLFVLSCLFCWCAGGHRQDFAFGARDAAWARSTSSRVWLGHSSGAASSRSA